MLTAPGNIVRGFRRRSGDLDFLDRLDLLRDRLLWMGAAILLGTAVGFYVVLNFRVLGVLVDPIVPYLGGEKIKYLSPTDPFFVTLKLALALGVLFALPILLFNVWKLISPLLLETERKVFRPAIAVSALLFVIGAVFCYILVLPLMLRFTMGFQAASLEQAVVIGEYLKIVLRMMLAFGLAFNLPIAILLLTSIGVVTPDLLAEKRRHAIAILVVLSAFITPPDVASLTLMAGPVWILYEISIVVSRSMLARRAARESLEA